MHGVYYYFFIIEIIIHVHINQVFVHVNSYNFWLKKDLGPATVFFVF